MFLSFCRDEDGLNLLLRILELVPFSSYLVLSCIMPMEHPYSQGTTDPVTKLALYAERCAL